MGLIEDESLSQCTVTHLQDLSSALDDIFVGLSTIGILSSF